MIIILTVIIVIKSKQVLLFLSSKHQRNNTYSRIKHKSKEPKRNFDSNNGVNSNNVNNDELWL